MNGIFLSRCLFVVALFSSCTHEKKASTLHFTVSNNSVVKLDSVLVLGPYGQIVKLTSIDSKSDAKGKMKVAYSDSIGEGAFTILIYVKDSLVNDGTFGYYSSPVDFRKEYFIEVETGLKYRELAP